jgi:hypothetical protein
MRPGLGSFADPGLGCEVGGDRASARRSAQLCILAMLHRLESTPIRALVIAVRPPADCQHPGLL